MQLVFIEEMWGNLNNLFMENTDVICYNMVKSRKRSVML